MPGVIGVLAASIGLDTVKGVAGTGIGMVFGVLFSSFPLYLFVGVVAAGVL